MLTPDSSKEPLSFLEDERCLEATFLNDALKAYVKNTPSKYFICHLGAKWCGPCQRMKKQTWESRVVKEAMEQAGAELLLLDEAKPVHKKLFRYYKVKRYPTVIFLDKNDLENPLYRTSGFMNATTMTKTIKRELKNDSQHE